MNLLDGLWAGAVCGPKKPQVGPGQADPIAGLKIKPQPLGYFYVIYIFLHKLCCSKSSYIRIT